MTLELLHNLRGEMTGIQRGSCVESVSTRSVEAMLAEWVCPEMALYTPHNLLPVDEHIAW